MTFVPDSGPPPLKPRHSSISTSEANMGDRRRTGSGTRDFALGGGIGQIAHERVHHRPPPTFYLLRGASRRFRASAAELGSWSRSNRRRASASDVLAAGAGSANWGRP